MNVVQVHNDMLYMICSLADLSKLSARTILFTDKINSYSA